MRASGRLEACELPTPDSFLSPGQSPALIGIPHGTWSILPRDHPRPRKRSRLYTSSLRASAFRRSLLRPTATTPGNGRGFTFRPSVALRGPPCFHLLQTICLHLVPYVAKEGLRPEACGLRRFDLSSPSPATTGRGFTLRPFAPSRSDVLCFDQPRPLVAALHSVPPWLSVALRVSISSKPSLSIRVHLWFLHRIRSLWARGAAIMTDPGPRTPGRTS